MWIHFLLCHYLFVSPSISKPPYNSSFQIFRNFPKRHILFHPIHPILKIHPGQIHVAYHATNITDDGSKYQYSSQEISNNKQIFRVVFRLRRFSYNPVKIKLNIKCKFLFARRLRYRKTERHFLQLGEWCVTLVRRYH